MEMVNKTEGIFYDYRIYLPQKLRNKTNKKKASTKYYSNIILFSKKWKIWKFAGFYRKNDKNDKI